MTTARAVTMIPPTIRLHSSSLLSATSKRRVAAYARVSTDNEEQLTSYEAQVDYYTRFIHENDEWEYIGVYTDVDTSYGLNPKSP